MGPEGSRRVQKEIFESIGAFMESETPVNDQNSSLTHILIPFVTGSYCHSSITSISYTTKKSIHCSTGQIHSELHRGNIWSLQVEERK